MITPLEKIVSGDQDLSLLQDRLKEFVNPLENNPLFDGVLLKSIHLLAAANTTIDHKLGRLPRGWVITDHVTAAATIHRISWSKTGMVLFASAACDVDLWVF